MGKGLAGFLEHGTSVLRHQMLRQVGNHRVLGCRYCSSGGATDACQYLQQGALSRTVLAHQGYAVLLVYLEGYILEQCRAAEFDGQSIYCYHVVSICLCAQIYL